MTFFHRKRIHGHSVLLLLLLILAYAVKFKTLASGPNDFLQFYVSGSMVLHHQAQGLYDKAALIAVPESQDIYFFPAYGPQVALFFAPFALLPFWVAALAWSLISVAMYVICCCYLWQACPNLRLQRDWVNMLVLALASPALFGLISHCQTSVLLLLAFTIAYFTLPKRPLIAGLAIGIAAYKPQFGIVIACACLLAQQWKVVIGAMTSILAQLSISWAVLGKPTMLAYVHTLSHAPEQYRLDNDWIRQMVSLRSFWETLIPRPYGFIAYVVTAVVLVFITLVAWRGHSSFKLKFALLLVATVLVSPHAFIYDLVVLLPALLFVEEWLVLTNTNLRRIFQVVLYGSYLFPLFAARLAVVSLFVLAFLLFHALRKKALDMAPVLQPVPVA